MLSAKITVSLNISLNLAISHSSTSVTIVASRAFHEPFRPFVIFLRLEKLRDGREHYTVLNGLKHLLNHVHTSKTKESLHLKLQKIEVILL